jgi:hypothetical protein
MAPIEALDDAARERLRQKYALLNDGSFYCLVGVIHNHQLLSQARTIISCTVNAYRFCFRVVLNMASDSAATKREYDDGDDGESDFSGSTNGKRMKGGSNDDPIETRRVRFGVQRLLVSFGHHPII